MHPIVTQIYEIQTPAEAEEIIGLGVDHVGTVLVSKEQWKQPVISDTREVVRELKAQSSIIPLFSEPDAVYAVIDHYRPDIVHLCEHLTDACHRSTGCKALVKLQAGIRTRFPDVRIMRSIPIAPAGFENCVPTLALARMFEPVSDLFLTDTLLISREPQPVTGFVGITGKTCDWETAAQLVQQSAIPVILAGGLAPDNVCAGIMAVRPAGVDSCTRTNAVAQDGKPVRFRKDMQRVGAFVEQTRRAEQALAREAARF
jgi:phosphoribosylanthranilate isomerase